MYSKPSISRLETREVYSWSSAAALPETHSTSAQSHTHWQIIMNSKTSPKWPWNSTHCQIIRNSKSFPNNINSKSSPPHYYYLLFINSKWSALRYELKINTNSLWVIFDKNAKSQELFWKGLRHILSWSPVVKAETPGSSLIVQVR